MKSVNIQPSFESLIAEAEIAHPDASAEMSVVAYVEPDVLDGSIGQVLDADYENMEKLFLARNNYEAELEKVGAEVTEELSSAAFEFSEAEKALESNRQRTDLAKKVRGLQDCLARPMRTAATVLSALAIGVGSGLYIAEEYPQTHGDTSTKQFDIEDAYKKNPAPIGILFGAMGAIAGNAVGSVMTGREAHRRAKKIIKNSQG